MGALSMEKFFWKKGLNQLRGTPQCRQSVPRNRWFLHALMDAVWSRISMVAPSPQMPVLVLPPFDRTPGYVFWAPRNSRGDLHLSPECG